MQRTPKKTNLVIIAQNCWGASTKNGISFEGITKVLETILAKTQNPKLLQSFPVPIEKEANFEILDSGIAASTEQALCSKKPNLYLGQNVMIYWKIQINGPDGKSNHDVILFNGTMHLHFFVLVHYQSRKCICAC
jgi:hypothetical protein